MRAVVDFVALMLAIALIILVGVFKSEHDSCERQGPIRESSNARRLAVNQLVAIVQDEKLGSIKQRVNLAVKTDRIPQLQKLHCGLPWPETK